MEILFNDPLNVDVADLALTINKARGPSPFHDTKGHATGEITK